MSAHGYERERIMKDLGGTKNIGTAKVVMRQQPFSLL
jgi:hypothetical protein